MWLVRFFMLIVLLGLWGCKKNDACKAELRSGDLIFITSDETDFSGAIADATATDDALNFVHVAIIAIADADTSVIEATPKYGVWECSWAEYKALLSSTHSGGVCAVVKRVNSPFSQSDAIERARGCIGYAYNWTFLPSDGKKYCSELVYDCYLNSDGSHIFSTTAMNFLDADGNMPKFWTDLFSSLGIPVPQGSPGTNPNDMSREAVLTEVMRL